MTIRCLVLTGACVAIVLAAQGTAHAQNNRDAAIIVDSIFRGIDSAVRSSQNGNNGYYPNNGRAPRYSPGGGVNNRPGNRWNNDYDYDYDYQPSYRPQPRYVQPQYTQPQYSTPQYVQPAPAAAPKQNVAPAPTMLKPVANSVVAKAKTANAADIQQLKAQLAEAQEEIVERLDDALKDYRVDRSAVIAELTAKEVDVDTQTALLQAMKKGDAERAQILWTTITKDRLQGETLAQQVEIQRWYDDLVSLAEEGEITNAELRQGKRLIGDLDLSAKEKKSILNALAELELNSSLAAVITKFKPSHNGALHTLPPSGFAVIRNPACNGVVWLGDGYIMAPGGETLTIETNGTLWGAMNWPVGVDAPCAPTNQKWIYDGVVLLGPDGENGQVNYVISGNDYKISSGQMQRLAAGTAWSVTFYPGGKAAAKTYKLSEGTYKFTPVQGAWELYTHKYSVEINNRSNPNSFNLVVDNKKVELAAGDSRTYESKYPIDVRYDRGNGTTERNLRLEDGVYKIAINPTDNLWDIYPGEQVDVDGLAGY